MKVTLKDGSVKEYAQAMSVIDIAKDLSEGLATSGMCRRSRRRGCRPAYRCGSRLLQSTF